MECERAGRRSRCNLYDVDAGRPRALYHVGCSTPSSEGKADVRLTLTDHPLVPDWTGGCALLVPPRSKREAVSLPGTAPFARKLVCTGRLALDHERQARLAVSVESSINETSIPEVAAAADEHPHEHPPEVEPHTSQVSQMPVRFIAKPPQSWQVLPV